MWTILLVSSLLVVLPSTVKSELFCETPFDFFDYDNIAHCILVVDLTYTWENANTFCKDASSFESSLVEINSRQLNNYVKGKLVGYNRLYWIGYQLDFANNKFISALHGMESAASFPFTYLMPENRSNEPRCMAIRTSGQGNWLARPCTQLRRFVCRHEPFQA